MKPRMSQIKPEGAAGTFPKVNATADGWDYGTPAAGATALIASQVLGSNASNITFSSISGSYNHLRLLVIARSTYAPTSAPLTLQANGISSGGAHYGWQTSGTGNTVGSYGPSDGSVDLGSCPGATANANSAAVVVVDIPGYALTTFQKVAMVQGGYAANSGSGDAKLTHFVARINTTAAITSLVIATQSGESLVAGSAAYLYGIT